ncbi:MAG: TOBE domain-containing protein [Methylobacter sp.]|uniref:TOBE domain-containing protein n=1 Tax=Methylobacter sp. TaxID=2051955 RepID=UPI0025858DCE|nr:TOBE domain-containing protein [Methylobacter sp.]MCL7421246.1 TOBE domain-containing protein [Methylobacter sp.]
MPDNPNDNMNIAWIEGELRLAGILDSRMIGLLRAIDESGSINQAAKQQGLSYKGAWQMIERANNLAPKVLIATTTGGSKGGGTRLTTAGQALLQLFTQLEQQHRQFLRHLNQTLADDPEMVLLLKPLSIKTSATNQLFGTITAIQPGSVNVEVLVELKGGETVAASMHLAVLERLELNVGQDVLLLINAPEISVVTESGHQQLSARNSLSGTVVRMQRDGIDAQVALRLSGGDSLVATITQASAKSLGLKSGMPVNAVFKSNAVMLAVAALDSVNS